MSQLYDGFRSLTVHSWLAIVSLWAGLTGCADVDKPLLVPVTGKVVHNNQPVTAGMIYFFPGPDAEYQKDNPSSLLQLDGSFAMKTFPFGDGIAPGKYKVVLGPELSSRLKLPDYGHPEKTPWEVDVPDTGLADIVLDAK